MKKLNFLRLTNLDEFVENFEGNLDSYYRSPFAILAELERKITFTEKLEPIILIPYKEHGDAIFELQSTTRTGEAVLAEYLFNSVVS